MKRPFLNRLPAWLIIAAALCGLLGAGCASTPEAPLAADAEMAKKAGQARDLFAFGRPDRAAALYAEALARARSLDDAAAIAQLAMNLAACLAETGDTAGALDALNEARAAADRAGRAMPEILALDLALRAPSMDPDQAAEACRRALDDPSLRKRGDLRARIGLLSADAGLRRGDIAAARGALARARKDAGSRPGPGLEARLAGIEGNILLAENQPADAGPAFEREAEAWGRAGKPGSVAEALARAGTAHEAAQSMAEAAGCYARAAQSHLAGGRPDAAGALLKRFDELPEGAAPPEATATADRVRRALESAAPR